MSKKQINLDTPWKDVLNIYFKDFMAFFFPEIYNDILWAKKYEFLDNELQKAVRDASFGRRLVDKLVKVWRKDGNETWLLIHIEIQSQKEIDFEKRMYIYNYRIFDRYDHPVVSLALLCDEYKNWKPDRFNYELWGFELKMKFPIVKLLDYKNQWDILEKSQNPFAIVVMAHLKALETRNNYQECKLWKINLARMLYEKRYKKQDIINLLRFIDWVMQLPRELEDEFWQELQQYEEGRYMPYLTEFEKKAIRRGLTQGFKEGKKLGIKEGIKEGIEEGIIRGKRQGILKGIELGLKLKFGKDGLSLLPEIQKISDLNTLEKIHSSIETVNNLEDLRNIYL